MTAKLPSYINRNLDHLKGCLSEAEKAARETKREIEDIQASMKFVDYCVEANLRPVDRRYSDGISSFWYGNSYKIGVYFNNERDDKDDGTEDEDHYAVMFACKRGSIEWVKSWRAPQSYAEFWTNLMEIS